MRALLTGKLRGPPVLALQTGGGPWTASPAGSTVGDTIQLERSVSAPPGWRVRAGKLPQGEAAEPLGAGDRGPVAGRPVKRC